MSKKLVINCASCDARKVTEEKLMAYDEVVINAALVITSVESRAIMDKFPVTMNCASVIDVEGDVQVSTVNGLAQIKSTDTLTGGKRFLIVNGSAEIGAGTEKVLEQYAGILINGSVIYPESVGACLGMMKVNGSSICYPDGAIVLKRSAVIDRTFALRAKKNLYWAQKRLIMVDPELDMEKLKQKGATFCAHEAIVAESKVEAAVELLDEKTEIVVVPDGTTVIMDDVTLNDITVKKYGTRLYILGEASVEKDAAAAIGSLEYLVICGDVSVGEGLKDLLLEKADKISGTVQVVKNNMILADKSSVRISAWLLEREPEGILVKDCTSVTIDPDVPKEMIVEKLSIVDCASVICSEDQEDAVGSICCDVANIGREGSALDVGKLIEEAVSAGTAVNCSEYVL